MRLGRHVITISFTLAVTAVAAAHGPQIQITIDGDKLVTITYTDFGPVSAVL